MSEKLKPCPFCGGNAEIERKGSARQSNIVACTCCGCRVESGDVLDPRASWNRRSDPRLAMAREALKTMESHILTIKSAISINDEWGRVVAGQTDAARALVEAFEAARATLATLEEGK